MAEIVNFNKRRKQKAREVAAQQAAENRVRYGRTPAQKAHDEAEAEAARQRLDRLQRDRPTTDPQD